MSSLINADNVHPCARANAANIARSCLVIANPVIFPNRSICGNSALCEHVLKDLEERRVLTVAVSLRVSDQNEWL